MKRISKVRVGQVYRIKKRYDTGGYPVIRIVAKRGYLLTVQDCREDGSLAPMQFGPSRPFRDSVGWPRLRKFWKREA